MIHLQCTRVIKLNYSIFLTLFTVLKVPLPLFVKPTLHINPILFERYVWFPFKSITILDFSIIYHSVCKI